MQFETRSFLSNITLALRHFAGLLVFFGIASAQASSWLQARYGKIESLKGTGIEDRYSPSAATMAHWERVFKKLNDSADETEISRALEAIVNDMIVYLDVSPKQAKEALIQLHSLRRVMPEEIRWALAALEIEAGIINKSTLVDLRSAAYRSTFGEESEGLLESILLPKLGARYAIACPPLKGENRTRDEIKLFNPAVGAFLMTNWHLISALEPENTNIEIERKRLEWFAEVSEKTHAFGPEQIAEILRVFNNSAMVTFSSADRQIIFLEYALDIVKKLSHRYGRYQVNDTGDMIYQKSAGKKSAYGKIRDYVGSWLYTDITFIVKNLPRLQREGFFRFDHIFEKQLSAADFATVKENVFKRKLNAEGHLAASLMLLSQKSDGADGNSLSSAERSEITDAVLEILTTAQEKSGLVNISGRGLQSIRTENGFFYTALEWFYNFSIDTKALTNDQGRAIFNNKIVVTSYLNEDDFKRLETLRLRVVSNSMDYDSYRTEMAKHLAKGTTETPEEQLRLAQRLGLVLKEKDRAAAGQFIRDRYTEKTKWGLFNSKVNWEADRGWPVKLMISVNPNDPDMQQHLVDVIVEQRVDSSISSGDALTYLAQTKSNSPKVKNFIIRHLRFPEAGDSVIYFLTLIRLFPESTADILGIVYRFRSDTTKLIPMMKVLLDESIKNPSLLENLKLEIQRDLSRSEAGKVYAGNNLADWLTIQVTKHKKTSCYRFYLGK